ncbi:MAG: DUF1566 domain-containing protein [Prevotella sp.]|nr:DUF1566 domain-containing protein [Prevotella sp.]
MKNGNCIYEVIKTLTSDQKLRFYLFNEYGHDAADAYKFITEKAPEAPVNPQTPRPDGVYYIYTDGTSELFDYQLKNEPRKDVARIGVVMGQHSLAVNMNDFGSCSLTNNEDNTEYDGYIIEFDDAVADWNGRSNTGHILEIGTNIALDENEWIPSVAELYLIYLNKRSINAAIELSGGSRIKDGWYWSSTELSATHAWFLDFIDGDLSNWYGKVHDSFYVCTVSAFD